MIRTLALIATLIWAAPDAAAAGDAGLRPLIGGYAAARAAGAEFRSSPVERAVITMGLESLTWTNGAPTPYLLKGKLYDGMLVRLAKDGKVESTRSLRPKLSQPFRPITLGIPAACGEMAKLALQTKGTFQIVGRVQTLELETATILVVIEMDENLQCTAVKGD